jgi:hypothetical protein
MQARAHDSVQTRGGNTTSVNHCLSSAHPFVKLVVGVASMHHRDFPEMHAEAPAMPLREDGSDSITAISGSLYLPLCAPRSSSCARGDGATGRSV